MVVAAVVVVVVEEEEEEEEEDTAVEGVAVVERAAASSQVHLYSLLLYWMRAPSPPVAASHLSMLLTIAPERRHGASRREWRKA